MDGEICYFVKYMIEEDPPYRDWETKQKISSTNKGKKFNKEHKDKLSKAKKDKNPSIPA